MRRPSAGRVGWLAVIAVILLVACQSGPGVAWRGAHHYGAGSAALDRGDTERAVTELERAVHLVPDASEVRNHLGIAYWRAGRTSAARAAFERAIELDCDNHAARENLARLGVAMRRDVTGDAAVDADVDIDSDAAVDAGRTATLRAGEDGHGG